MNLIELIEAIPQIYIYLMGFILIIALFLFVKKKIKGRKEDVDEEEFFEPKDEFQREKIPYTEVCDKNDSKI